MSSAGGKEQEIEILFVGQSSSYSIPHFHVITVKLRHVQISNWEAWTDKEKAGYT